MTKIYAVQYGFYSNFEPSEFNSLWSTKELAMNIVKKEIDFHNLEQSTHRKTKKLVDVWTNGDYYVTISEVNLDSEYLYGDET